MGRGRGLWWRTARYCRYNHPAVPAAPQRPAAQSVGMGQRRHTRPGLAYHKRRPRTPNHETAAAGQPPIRNS